MELKDIVLKKGDIVTIKYSDNKIDKLEINSTLSATNIMGIILKIERPKHETIYKAPKEILDKEEKEYLENVIRPFKNRVKYIEKGNIGFYYPTKEFLSEYIYVNLGYNSDSCSLPRFKKGTMYKGMELKKKYTLDELRLFKE